MKRISSKIITLFFLFTTSLLMAQISHGTVQESLTMESKILHKTVRYTIYLENLCPLKSFQKYPSKF